MAEHHLVILAAVAFEAALGAAAWVVGWLFGVDPLAHLFVTPRGLAEGLLAAAPPSVLLVVADRFGAPVVRQIRREARRMIQPMFQHANAWDLAAVSAAAGWGEELLFRGLIQQGVSQAAGNLFGVVAASLLFGLVHPISRAYVVTAAGMGVYFGGVYLLTGNLLTAIIAHGLYDLVALVYLLRFNLDARPSVAEDESVAMEEPQEPPDA